MSLWLVVILLVVISFAPALAQVTYTIPDWVRNNAQWWNEGKIPDVEFNRGLEYMIKHKFIDLSSNTQIEYKISHTPSWLKKQAGWWTEGIMSDAEFTRSIQYLIKTGVIVINGNDQQGATISHVPASSGTIIHFYVNDVDLDTSPNGVDVISTDGLIEITINGEIISIPSNMIETAPSSGKFIMSVNLPDTINGEELDQNDIVLIKYFDNSDARGQERVITQSFTLSKAFASLQTSGGGQRIGHEFVIRIYEPDANRDSRDEDKISLSLLEFRAEGGIRTTLANPVFQANRSFLVETGPNSSTFEVIIKIPRSIDGKTIHIGDWYEIRYVDDSNPSGTSEKIVLKGRIG